MLCSDKYQATKDIILHMVLVESIKILRLLEGSSAVDTHMTTQNRFSAFAKIYMKLTRRIRGYLMLILSTKYYHAPLFSTTDRKWLCRIHRRGHSDHIYEYSDSK